VLGSSFFGEKEDDDMKPGFGILLTALVFAGGGSNLLKNGDFEKFVGGEPQGWTTNNIPSMLVLVSPSSSSASGKTSVRCDVKSFYGTAMAGLISQKDIRVTPGELQLTGSFLLNSVGNDAGFVSIDVKSDRQSTVATCEHRLTQSAGTFVPFTLSARLPNEARTIDLLLTLIAGTEGESLHEGSFVLFDGLELTVRSTQQ
jgi:hypothetical protein